MSGLKRAGIALLVGAACVGVAGLAALVSGNAARLIDGCWVIFAVGVGAALVMSGVLFIGGSYPSLAATTPLPAPADDQRDDDPVDAQTRARLNSVYPVIACVPAVLVLLLHYR